MRFVSNESCAAAVAKCGRAERYIMYFAVTLVGVAARGSLYASSTDDVFACGMHMK